MSHVVSALDALDKNTQAFPGVSTRVGEDPPDTYLQTHFPEVPNFTPYAWLFGRGVGGDPVKAEDPTTV